MSEPPELLRRKQRDSGAINWDLWGTYLSDRQWGTVREDYSFNGDAWSSFPFDHSHSRTYRWGEDGLLGLSDNKGLLCFAPAFWNGEDPILKERLFGLGNPEGNHGEDIKEYMFHLAGTPTGSYAKALYKYPQRCFPYEQLRQENKKRDRSQPEYELVDTGIFEENRYFDITVEYAKADSEDILIRITAINRGPQTAHLHILPHLWLRNTWAWGTEGETRQSIHCDNNVLLSPPLNSLESYELSCREKGDWWFTENETNTQRLFNQPLQENYVKDAFHRFLIEGDRDAINPEGYGSKAALHLEQNIAAGESWCVDLRLRRRLEGMNPVPFSDDSFEQVLKQRETEWQEYLEWVAPQLSADDRTIHSAACAGLYWGRKFYNWFVYRWLLGDSTGPTPPPQRWENENAYWRSMRASDIISMPDCWEYPYFCQWDLMFHAVAFAELDPYEAKKQANILRTANYVATNGQSPAYEWALSDPNPPIGAWAALRIHQIEKKHSGEASIYDLAAHYRKLLLDYGWWANRTDSKKDSMFDGGFLGLDNIAIFDRSHPLKDGSTIEQPDGTSWMGMYSLNMLEITVEISHTQPGYNDSISRFVKDFWKLAYALNANDRRNFVSWDEQDGFYYDIVKRPDGSADYLRTRSLAGLIPLLAVASFDRETVEAHPCLNIRPLLEKRSIERGQPFEELNYLGKWHNDRVLYSLVPKDRLIRILKRVFDEDEFLSPYGIRGLSKYYQDHPYSYREGSEEGFISYSPADSPIPMFGGNSNWRGPVWIPINYLLIEALQKYSHYYGDDFKMEFPTGSGQWMNLWDISLELEKRLISIFRKDNHGRRPFNGNQVYFDQDQYWRDLILFNEYFNGDNGAGVGASHQTGWTAIVLKMITQLNRYS
tara:strand:+ start:17 stop:2671 length:2655 start_codon:yes stop_codon:yes gene_type:complete